MAAWNRASKTDIQHQVRTQLRPASRRQSKWNQDNANAGREAWRGSRRSQQTASRGKQQSFRCRREAERAERHDNKTCRAYAWTVHMNILKPFTTRRMGLTRTARLSCSQVPPFKRELNFLIDSGYLANIDLSGFQTT